MSDNKTNESSKILLRFFFDILHLKKKQLSCYSFRRSHLCVDFTDTYEPRKSKNDSSKRLCFQSFFFFNPNLLSFSLGILRNYRQTWSTWSISAPVEIKNKYCIIIFFGEALPLSKHTQLELEFFSTVLRCNLWPATFKNLRLKAATLKAWHATIS